MYVVVVFGKLILGFCGSDIFDVLLNVFCFLVIYEVGELFVFLSLINVFLNFFVEVGVENDRSDYVCFKIGKLMVCIIREVEMLLFDDGEDFCKVEVFIFGFYLVFFDIDDVGFENI